MPKTEIITWKAIPADESAAVQRREIRGSGALLKQLVIKAGTAADRHSHDFEQFLLVVEGLFNLTTEEGVTELRPGMVVRFDPDAWHSAVFLEDTVLVEVNLALSRPPA